MIWKSLAAVVGAIVLVIAINFIGEAVHNASTPVDVVAEGDAANTPLNETPTVSKADVGEGTTVAQTTEDTATQVKPTPQTSLGTDNAAADQPITQQSTAVPVEGSDTFQEQAQEQVKEGEQAQPEPGSEPAAQTAAQPAENPAQGEQQQAAAGAVAGDPEAGKAASRVCAACHSFDQGGPNKVGPNLFGVVGASIAHRDDFNYSAAMKDAEGDWTVEKLDAYLANPKAAIPGNKMGFAGLKDDAKRQDVIAYLASLK